MSLNAVNPSTGEISLIAGSTMYADSPIGTILAYGGSTAPSGWLLCQGQSLLRTDYPDLFNVIGTAFGSVDSTHFSLPDARECALVGSGQNGTHTIASHDTYTVGQFKDDQLQNHNHVFAYGSNVGVNDAMLVVSNQVGGAQGPYVANARKGDTTRGKRLGVNFIIKAKQVGAPADFISAVDAIIEQGIIGTDDNSYYKKYASGLIEMWFTYKATATLSGSPIAYTSIIVPLPMPLRKVPLMYSTTPLSIHSAGAFVWTSSTNYNSTTSNQLSLSICSFYAYNLNNLPLKIHVVGFWQ